MPILFNEKAREKLLAGIKTISDSVKSTMGPGGRTVIIDSNKHTRGLIITKDGVTVAKHVYSDDAVENLGIRILREASEQTADEAGDGTTTAIVIAEKMSSIGMVNTGAKTTAVIREINKLSEKAIEFIQSKSKRVTKNNLESVATISANGDKSLGKIISSVYKKIGLDGAVSIENSQTEETYAEISKGIKFARGYYNQLFVNDQISNECRLEECLILITDIQIDGINQIMKLIEYSIQVEKKPLLLIAPMSQSAIAMCARNFREGYKLVPVEPPGFGYKQTTMLADLAVATGAKFISREEGDNLELVTPADLGIISSVKISKSHTIIESVTESDEKVSLTSDLRTMAAKEKNKKDREFLQTRLSILNGMVGTIFVGASSDIERKEKFDRVDDAVCAVRSALEEGVIPGGGVALLRSAEYLGATENIDSPEKQFAMTIIQAALSAPFNQIMLNAEVPDEVLIDFFSGPHIDNFNFGINAATGEICDMLLAGIIDPAKVTTNALKNAVSVSTTIMSTATTITQTKQS
jgi:chaperonin GroEL